MRLSSLRGSTFLRVLDKYTYYIDLCYEIVHFKPRKLKYILKKSTFNLWFFQKKKRK